MSPTLLLEQTHPLGYYLLATVLRVRGLRIVIYSNDHVPPHVHVIGPNAEAKIALGSRHGRASVLVNSGLSRAHLASALTEINRNEALLLRRWKEIHGDT